MVDKAYLDDLLEKIEKMDVVAQQQLMEYAHVLASMPVGEPGWQFVEALQKLQFTPEDLAEMNAAMADLERIDPDEWDLSS